MEQDIKLSPVYSGLLRPPVVFGIPLDAMTIIVGAAMVCFVLGHSPLYMLASFPLYIVSWVCFQADPYCFAILRSWLQLRTSANKSFWQGQSYAPW